MTVVEDRTAFSEFFAEAEPRLRRALIAAYGPEAGREAAADALSYAWEHWERVHQMENGIGYLYRVGQSAARRYRRRPARADAPSPAEPWIEPGLDGALDRLSRRQRTVVVLRYGFDWTQAEVAEALGLSVASVQKHQDRGMAKLRSALEVGTDG
jgi:DNA-directed RNA polymerase specialized sigma24 family protein